MESFDVSKLKSTLEDIGIQLSWALCQNFIANLVSEISSLELHIDTINTVASKTFQSVDFSITIGSSSKPSRSDVETCQKLLQSGVNKGKKCSLLKTANSSFCKRHLNMIMKSTQGQDNETKNKQINNFREIVTQKKQKRKTRVKLQLRPIEDMQDVFVETQIGLLFEEIDNKLVVVGHMYDDDIQYLSKKDIQLCDNNGWEYYTK